MQLTDEIKRAFQLACEARERAYAPYTNWQVGACLKVKGQDELIIGNNVEDVTLRCGACAERTAIFNGLAKFKDPDFEYIVISSKEKIYPCGVCLQMCLEVGHPDLKFYIGDTKEILEERTLKEMLPFAYVNKHLKSNIID